MRKRLSTLVIVVVLAAAVAAQVPAKKPIAHDVYDTWRSIRNTQIARDGTWVVYALVPQDADGEVVARNLRTNTEYRHPRGTNPVLTVDAKFVVFTIAPPKAEVEKAKKAKKKPEDEPKPGVGIMSLATGVVTTAERVKNFKVPEESGRFVAYLTEAAPRAGDAAGDREKKDDAPAAGSGRARGKRKDPGTDLIVQELASGTKSTVGEVVEYAWTKDGNYLAYATSSRTPANDGAFVRGSSDGSVTPLATGRGHYKSFAFDDALNQIAFLTDKDTYEQEAPTFAVYHTARGTLSTSSGQAGRPAAQAIVSAATTGLPKNWAPSENGRLEFSKDGSRLFLGTAAAPRAEPEDGPEPIKVDIWNWKDPLLQPMQKARADQERRRTYRAVLHLKDTRVVQLGAEDLPEVDLTDNDGPKALGTSNMPYRPLISWDGTYSDIFLVNVADGARQPIFTKMRGTPRMSPGGTYLLYFDPLEADWFTYRISDGRRQNLTEKLGVHFENEDQDRPTEPGPYGNGGWTSRDESVLLYDQFDIWDVKPDGSGGRQLTGGVGRKQHIVFRRESVDPDERTVAKDKPVLLTAIDDRTKASGFYRVSFTDAAPTKLMMIDKAVNNLIKAKNADTFVFTMSRFEEFPDLWTSGPQFTDAKKISNANPQQANYVWGKAELMEYRNTDGKVLSALLQKPEDFSPATKYPLMVYIYEERTNALHSYTAPSPGTSINITRYVSNGYIVLQPDIVYDTGYPGESAMKCVIPAIQKVVDMGYVDPERIGIQGHSWGGYQISYMITRTNMFRAVEAGASVVNMTSAYGGIRWGPGQSRAVQYEKGQSRIDGPPWERPLHFIENSPLFWIEKVHTPYLTIHNDEDDAVPWYQGIEFFTAMRRLGKEAYMFTYNGERHGLRQRENQKHWTVHMAEFFDHYLKGSPRPEWMDKGVPFLEKGKRDLTPLFRKTTNDGR